MTILATTNNGFLIQASEQEMARLAGYYSISDCRPKLVIGAEIQVNAMYDQLYKMRYVGRSIKEIEERANNLLETIKIKSPIIAPIISAIEEAAPKS
jgi:hypothetical protein